MFWIRLKSSLILTVITLFTVIMGGNILFATIFVISIIGLTEIYKVLKINVSLLGMLGYLSCASYYLLMFFDVEQYNMVIFLLLLMLLMFIYVFAFPKYNINHITLVFFGLFYVAIMLSYIYKVRMLEDGALVIWLIFIGAWGSDTCAYLVGVKFGKHRLSPKLSPKKSIEGSIGGILGAAFLGFVYASLFKESITGVAYPQLVYPVICGVASMISQVGDLAASGIKRNYDIKDYSSLIPGHGGILDRFDSIIFTAPIVYFLAKLF